MSTPVVRLIGSDTVRVAVLLERGPAGPNNTVAGVAAAAGDVPAAALAAALAPLLTGLDGGVVTAPPFAPRLDYRDGRNAAYAYLFPAAVGGSSLTLNYADGRAAAYAYVLPILAG